MGEYFVTTEARKSHLGRNTVIALGGLVLLAIFAFYVLRGGNTPLTGISYPNVTVSGNVQTIGAGTTPNRVDFHSDTGQNFSASVSSNVFSISLPNQHSYTATVAWNALGGLSSGTCKGGTLNLNLNAGATTYNISC
jgi:hypothetical protein